MAMGIGSMIGGVSAGVSAAKGASSSARNSGASGAVDEFNSLIGTTQAERVRALKFAQEGLKAEDRKPVDHKEQQAAHQTQQSKVGQVLDIKA